MVAGRGRAVVVGVGSNTAMGSIHDSMLQTDDVSYQYSFVFIWKCTIFTFICFVPGQNSLMKRGYIVPVIDTNFLQ